MNKEQQWCHDVIIRACTLGQCNRLSRTDDGDDIGRLQLMIGAGGCGKSYVIDCIVNTLVTKYGWKVEEILILATTGKAASGVGGTNAHTTLKLPVRSDYRKLKKNALKDFQKALKNQKWNVKKFGIWKVHM